MSDIKRKRDLAQVKKSLSILKSKGLYKPENARAKPTRYGLSLLKKYSDVVAGRAFVEKAPKSALSKLAQDFKVTRGRVVIPKLLSTSRPIITKSGDVIRRSKFGTSEYRYRAVQLRNGELPDLKPYQSYTVMVLEGRKPVQYSYSSKEEMMRVIAEYQPDGNRGFDMLKYVQIAEPIGKLRYRISVIKNDVVRKRTVKAASSEMAVDVFRDKFPDFSDWIIFKIEALDE